MRLISAKQGGGDIDVNGALRILRERRKEAERALKKERGAREDKAAEAAQGMFHIWRKICRLCQLNLMKRKLRWKVWDGQRIRAAREEREFVGRTGVYAAGGLTGIVHRRDWFCLGAVS